MNNRILFLTAFVSCILLLSCERNYNCECIGPVDNVNIIKIKAKNKDDARSKCKTYGQSCGLEDEVGLAG